MTISEPFLGALNSDRLYLERLAHTVEPFQASNSDVVRGLKLSQPKSLPAKYFYDDLGSGLFEQICGCPEYYPTRTETAILQSCATDIAKLTGSCELVELGSGSAVKTRILLNAYRDLNYPLRYLPIDISAGILESSAFSLLADYPTLEVHGLVGTYELALQRLTNTHLPTRMLVFLGSTLGNLNPQECDLFFKQITGAMQMGEYFLLGVDLQKSERKPKEQLEAAYNDAQGITAQFNLNMLQHLNHKFNGDFDLTKFEHKAIYNDQLSQIEMYLYSLATQTVNLRSLSLSVNFEVGEKILTEISRKFDLTELEKDLNRQGLSKVASWTDPNQWFALSLFRLV